MALLIGDANPNTLTGGAEDDVLVGHGGADTLNGGGGSDTVDYSQESGPLGARFDSLLEEYFDTFGNRETITSIENVIGTTRNDELYGDFGANTLRGGDGDDTLGGRGGGDVLIGGNGNDTYRIEAFETDTQIIETADGGSADRIEAFSDDYTLTAANIEILEGVSLSAQTLMGGAGADTIIKRWNGAATFFGMAGDDLLVGSFGADLLDGGLDDDQFVGGGGADTLYGDAGSDTVRYDLEGGGRFVTVNLGANTAIDTHGWTDVLYGVENVVGFFARRQHQRRR